MNSSWNGRLATGRWRAASLPPVCREGSAHGFLRSVEVAGKHAHSAAPAGQSAGCHLDRSFSGEPPLSRSTTRGRFSPHAPTLSRFGDRRRLRPASSVPPRHPGRARSARSAADEQQAELLAATFAVVAGERPSCCPDPVSSRAGAVVWSYNPAAPRKLVPTKRGLSPRCCARPWDTRLGRSHVRGVIDSLNTASLFSARTAAGLSMTGRSRSSTIVRASRSVPHAWRSHTHQLPRQNPSRRERSSRRRAAAPRPQHLRRPGWLGRAMFGGAYDPALLPEKTYSGR